jgi:hypothetical protein
MIHLGPVFLVVLASSSAFGFDQASEPATQPAKWLRGPPSDLTFFPLAVWLQAPSNADRYRKAGFNTYVGLWEGPTEAQLAGLKKAGMRVICEQNEVSLRHLDDPTIVGWIHGDEPDNAQSRGARFGWSSPIAPEKVVEEYARMKSKDPTRPVLVNLGQGVAWDGWYGRGTRKNHPEDYPKYLEGADIASFDIYPAAQKDKEVAGNLWFVARGVEHLVQWSGGSKVVWNCLECTRVQNPDRKATPHEVRCEAWMSLIHGSRGLVYFAHEFKPKFREAALLDDGEMLEAVTALNRQITDLAPVLNSSSISNAATVVSENPAVPVAMTVKVHEGVIYLFAVAMREGSTTASFTLKNVAGDKSVEVIGESRTLPVGDGVFRDRFNPWDVHLYRLTPAARL